MNFLKFATVFFEGIIRTNGKTSHFVAQDNYFALGLNGSWMNGWKCEVPVCRLYFIRAFVILSVAHLSKYVCTPSNSFHSHRISILVLYALNMLLKFIKISDKYFFEWSFVASLFKILISFTGFNALSSRAKFWCLVHEHALRSLECEGFVEKWITYVTIA